MYTVYKELKSTAQLDFNKNVKVSCRLQSVAVYKADYINLKIFLPVSIIGVFLSKLLRLVPQVKKGFQRLKFPCCFVWRWLSITSHEKGLKSRNPLF